MTWLRRPEDLVIATLDIRRAGEILVHPCTCGNRDGRAHSIGEHVWDATLDMRPGIKAASYQAKGSTNGDSDQLEASDEHQRLIDLVVGARAWCLDLAAFLQRHRPDRHLAAVTEDRTATDDQWCRAHLAAGYCHPRFRTSEFCRWCTEFMLAYRGLDDGPPVELLRMHHEQRRIRQPDVDAAVKAERKRLKAERRKARTAS